MDIKIFHLLTGLFFMLVIISLTQATQIKKQLEKEDREPQVIETRLETPWEIQVSERGDIYYTEISGKLNVIIQEDGYQTFPIKVTKTTAGGLLGVALHPDFAHNSYIYIFKTVGSSGNLKNQIVRYQIVDRTLTNGAILVNNIPASDRYNGGYLRFGPDGNLYATTGSENQEIAQQISSLAGKILRLTADGTVPPDNPFQNLVYASGFTNPTGLTWDDKDKLWAADNENGNSEINLIEKGKDYSIGSSAYNSNTASAFGGLAFFEGRLYAASLNDKEIITLQVEGDKLGDKRVIYRDKFGKIREVYFNHTQMYVANNNRNGGNPVHSDDQILIVAP